MPTYDPKALREAARLVHNPESAVKTIIGGALGAGAGALLLAFDLVEHTLWFNILLTAGVLVIAVGVIQLAMNEMAVRSLEAHWLNTGDPHRAAIGTLNGRLGAIDRELAALDDSAAGGGDNTVALTRRLLARLHPDVEVTDDVLSTALKAVEGDVTGAQFLAGELSLDAIRPLSPEREAELRTRRSRCYYLPVRQ